jgi:valyl-tRNA synthetase
MRIIRVGVTAPERRFRRKEAIMAKATMKKARVKTTPDNAAGLALLTSDGNPLVRHDSGPKKKSKTDSVGETFRKLLAAANEKEQQVRPLGFKYIRKTISTKVLKLTDEYTQQQALAQSRKTVAAINYTGTVDFTKMNTALKTIWAELEPMFKEAAKKVEAERRLEKADRRAAYLERQKAQKKARQSASGEKPLPLVAGRSGQ